jgi:hypothetical protein
VVELLMKFAIVGGSWVFWWLTDVFFKVRFLYHHKMDLAFVTRVSSVRVTGCQEKNFPTPTLLETKDVEIDQRD